MHKGHYGEYSGNAKWSKVTNSNMGATKRDDEAHMEYLKEDVDYDDKHGHSDSSMTSDEKHISKLAGDLKYDEKKHHGSPAKSVGAHSMRPGDYASHLASASEHKAPSDEERKGRKHKSDVKPTNKPPTKMVSPFNADEKRGGHSRRFQKGAVSKSNGKRQLPSPDEAWAQHLKQAHHQSAPAQMVSPLNDSYSTNKKHGSPVKAKSIKGSKHNHSLMDAKPRHEHMKSAHSDVYSRVTPRSKNTKRSNSEDSQMKRS